MSISATVHVLPNVEIGRIFEVRRLAAAAGCQFVSGRSKRALRAVPPYPTTPGDAA